MLRSESVYTRYPIALLFALLVAIGCTPDEWGGDGDPPGGGGDDDTSGGGGFSGNVESGALLRDALIVDLTPAGIDAIEIMAESMGAVPVPMDPISEQLGEMEGCDWSIQVSNLTVLVDFDDLSIQPISHGLDIDADTSISINSAASPIDLFLDANGGIFDSCNLLDMHCSLWVDPMDVTLGMDMWLEVTDPGGSAQSYMDAIVSTPDHNLDQAFDSDGIQLSGCLLATINDLLGFFGTDLVGAMIDEQIGDLFASVEQELPGQIETAIEDGFRSASLDETLDIVGTPVDLLLEPRDVMIEPDGVRVLMNAAFDAPPAACVAEYDPGSFYYEESPYPAVDGTATHHAAAFVADDLLDGAMYTFWRGGVLCYALDPADLGFPLDTSFLSLMVDEEHTEEMNRIWLGEAQPMQIQTLPRSIPELLYDGEYDVEFAAEDMGLGFYGFTQDRMARIFTVDVDVVAGIDVSAVGDGSLALDVALDTDNLAPRVSDTEFVPWYVDEIEANFADIVLGILDTALDSLLGDLAVGPFDLGGIGLTYLSLEPAGPSDVYLAAYLGMDVVDPAASCDMGCGEDGCAGAEEGCGSGEGSCEGSCSQARTRKAARAWAVNGALFVACLGVIWAQRRRHG